MDEKLITRTIRSLRLSKKISLDILSKLSGLSPGYLSKVERSEKAPPLSTLNKIALALGTELSYLLKEESDEVVPPYMLGIRLKRRPIPTACSRSNLRNQLVRPEAFLMNLYLLSNRVPLRG